jgi:hypothetical protein
MENKFVAKEEVWFIVKSGENVHHGKIKPGEVLASINTINTYKSEEEWKEALKVLGVEPMEVKPKTTVFEMPMPKIPKFKK